ncbi:nucleoside deaminase [Flavobacterium sp. LC2016-01]|uniref:nucleoside deaminase n=1 Tax=Flavobacterium sp. LC2016-01 TaxID=2675876 RepID=UPI0012BADB90|nr:nucleoside deaminase [Flavobacterium sp. LC2016-01]MTH16598.1 nucleoside deaminase [Flavobacterium sp. LC2016-01]
MQEDFQYYMNQCLDLAKTALKAGNPPVGALIVLDGKVIGTGIESGKSTGDITNHAEILAVKDTLKNGFSDKLHLAQMYTTHEPCIMCSYMIRHHKIAKIIFGTAVPHVGGFTSKYDVLNAEDVPKWGNKPKVIADVCVEECNVLNAQFLELLGKSV